MSGKSGSIAVVLMIVIVIALLSIFDRGEQLFGLTPSNINVNIAAIQNASSTLSSSLRKPTNDFSTGIPYGADVDDDLAELHPDGDGGSIVFPGAREWYDYWSYASRKGKIHLIDEETIHVHDAYVMSSVESVSEATLQHITDMKSRYESVGALPDFYARGIGWIMDRLDMILTVVVAGEFADKNAPGLGPLHSGNTTIFIVDTVGNRKCDGEGESWMDAQPPLTMWVRANGKASNGEGEIFAGTALPHKLQSSSTSRCAWRYDFEPTYSGVYSIHVKVLTFNGFYDSLNDTCPTLDVPPRNQQFDTQTLQGDSDSLVASNGEFVNDLAVNGNFSHHRGLSGFKMYDVVGSCCEACKRARNCRMFSVPGAEYFDECELYFDRIEDDVDFLDRDSGDFLGRDRKYSFVGQDPSDFPSVRRRMSRKLVVSPDEIRKTTWPIKEHPKQGFPPAGITSEAVSYFIGCGWASTMQFESPCHYPSDDLVFGSGQKVEVVGTQHEHAELGVEDGLRACNLDDEKLDVSYGRWVRHIYPDDSECSPAENETTARGFRVAMLQYNGNRPPECWHRDDLTQIANTCGEAGCQWVVNHRWVTDLKREENWYGFWQPYQCHYLEMGDNEIQQCIDRKQISSITLQGASIKQILTSYMSQKLQAINMTTEGNRTVFLDTLKMPHILWHNGLRDHQEHLETNFVSVVDDTENEYYWITGFYYTSEREPHVQVDRSLQFSKMADDILTPKGYKMINAFDVTSAFAFDTDGQSDGLHITGPPIKAIVAKFFHHLCRMS